MLINIHNLESNQLLALEEVKKILDIDLDKEGISITLQPNEVATKISYDGAKGTIAYEKPHHFIRALGRFVEEVKKEKPFEILEQASYSSLGAMIDCSRNGVLHFKGFKRLVHTLALMGYSSIQLYTEDTFQLEGYPYFGHLRGCYTKEELKKMDAYAQSFSIELIPCIQTLAHLGAALRWSSFAPIIDCNDILLAEDENTYTFLEAMFKNMSESIASRKINIGMDEAHMVGLGRYLDQHGYQNRAEIMIKHFNRVMAIARKYGYEPMMWSDMFFRLAAGGEYYKPECKMDPAVIAGMPEDITLVYWDYYSEKSETYDLMMKKHQQLTKKLMFAGGAWKWMGFSPGNAFSKHIGEIAHEKCIKNKVEQVLITCWGDNGAEAPLFSILPTLQLWAEMCYTNCADENYLKERFYTCTKGDYTDFMQLDLPMLVPDNKVPGKCSVNPCKYLLYQDVLYGLFDAHVDAKAYKEHFKEASTTLQKAMVANKEWEYLFKTQYTLCKVLEIKASVGIEIRTAYEEKDKEKLSYYSKEVLPALREHLLDFIQAFREQWQRENKIFGLDAFDLRIGGLLQRIEVAIERINAYVIGEVTIIEELEEPVLPYIEGREGAISANLWHTICTPSVLAGV